MTARRPAPASSALVCWVFLRGVGLVYLVAFLSLWVQIDGLVGSRGILPVGPFLDRVHETLGAQAYWKLPTLCWFGHADALLAAFCAAGVTLAALLVVGFAPIPVLLLAWATYLSLVSAGQTFLSFQWDTLLLETGFVALFVAPAALRPGGPFAGSPPSRAGLWLLRLLLFKLMFLSGIVKLLSMDRTWWELTALDYHYFTQPLPSWIAWYAQQLPGAFQRASVFVMFVIELGVPVLIFFGRTARLAACAALLSLQVLIAATGNYGFFNLLTVVLCVPLLDDAHVRRFLPTFLREGTAMPRGRSRVWRCVSAGLVSIVLLASALSFVREIVRTASRGEIEGPAATLLEAGQAHLLGWGQPYVLDWTDPFHTINGYGLFRAMTTARPEIEVEGSADGREWRAYAFRFKPGGPARKPRFVAPHQPRLDWQMWFAALDPRGAEPWLAGFARRLLEGSPEVLGLLQDNPFPDAPPTYLRFVAYRYEFTDRKQRRDSGEWWTRQHRGVLYGPLSLEGDRRP